MGRKLTTEDIKERIYSVEGDNYELLSEYVNSQTKVKVKHVVCGYEYEVRWGHFQSGRRCPKCSNCYKYNDSEISELVSEMTNGEYTKLSAYKNNKAKFSIRHNLCGHEYEIAWNTFQKGSRCPKCRGFSNEDIVQKIFELVADEYTKLDDFYEDSQTKFSIRHNKCGHEYMVCWNAFQKGNRCPCCNQSKGEKFIEDYLTNQGISFATQVRFSDCRHKLPLPFDFGIIDDNKRVICLVEFDGRQHFEPIEAWGGEEALKEVQLRDRVKDEYCKKKGIPLLRIRYDDEDIEEKLNLFLYGLKAEKEV